MHGDGCVIDKESGGRRSFLQLPEMVFPDIIAKGRLLSFNALRCAEMADIP
jgi:hypothetical protein